MRHEGATPAETARGLVTTARNGGCPVPGLRAAQRHDGTPGRGRIGQVLPPAPGMAAGRCRQRSREEPLPGQARRARRRGVPHRALSGSPPMPDGPASRAGATLRGTAGALPPAPGMAARHDGNFSWHGRGRQAALPAPRCRAGRRRATGSAPARRGCQPLRRQAGPAGLGRGTSPAEAPSALQRQGRPRRGARHCRSGRHAHGVQAEGGNRIGNVMQVCARAERRPCRSRGTSRAAARLHARGAQNAAVHVTGIFIFTFTVASTFARARGAGLVHRPRSASSSHVYRYTRAGRRFGVAGVGLPPQQACARAGRRGARDDSTKVQAAGLRARGAQGGGGQVFILD